MLARQAHRGFFRCDLRNVLLFSSGNAHIGTPWHFSAYIFAFAMNIRNLEPRTQPKKPQEEQAYFSVVQFMINKGKDACRPQQCPKSAAAPDLGIGGAAIPDGISFWGAKGNFCRIQSGSWWWMNTWCIMDHELQPMCSNYAWSHNKTTAESCILQV